MDEPIYFNYNNIDGMMTYEERPSYNLAFRGQIKLFFTLLRFLIFDVFPIFDENDEMTVLYIGSAPGNNIAEIVTLFKNKKIQWVLYDPRKHCKKLYNLKNVKVINGLFTAKECNIYKNIKHLVYISDIRTLSEKEPTPEDLKMNMDLQIISLKIMNPKISLLKFRYLFPNQFIDNFIYPVGKLNLQIFNNWSTETRLVPVYPYIFKTMTYEDCLEYEEKMMFFNNFRSKNKNYEIDVGIFILIETFKFLKLSLFKKREEWVEYIYKLRNIINNN